MRFAFASLVLGLALAAAPGAHACGVCDEDKVAAAYDHAVVSGAIARGHVVVFAEVQGGEGADAAVARVREAAMGVRGIERGSVRTAASPAALSFALDPAVRSPAAALAAVERAGRSPAIKLRLLKVLS